MKDKTVNAVLIESIKGNLCKLVNPWLNEKVQVLHVNKGAEVKIVQEKDGVMVFETMESGKYLVIPEERELSINTSVFQGIQNAQPK